LIRGVRRGHDLCNSIWTRLARRGVLINLHKGMRMKTLTLSLLAAILMTLSGCNTVEGAGKDVKATGQAVEKAADKAKTY
jgi:predicted small secreted protein